MKHEEFVAALNKSTSLYVMVNFSVDEGIYIKINRYDFMETIKSEKWWLESVDIDAHLDNKALYVGR